MDRSAGQDAQLRAFANACGNGMQVGFSAVDGSGSRGCVSFEALDRALRPDMRQLFKPDYLERVESTRDYFRMIYNPRLMFDFNQFRALFAAEVIPSQAVIFRTPILFNPAQLVSFGIP